MAEKNKVEIPADVMQGRHAWFWRRITLQAVLTSLNAMLAYSVYITSALKNDWTTFWLQLSLISAIVWLITIYFAAVNDAAKITKVIGSIGAAVGDARDGQPTPRSTEG